MATAMDEVKEELKSATTTIGALCVKIVSTTMKLEWPAEIWDTLIQAPTTTGGPTLDKVLVVSFWMTLAAMAMRTLFGLAQIMGLATATVAIIRILE